MKKWFYTFFVTATFHVFFTLTVHSQCTLPGGSILINSTNLSSVSNISSGQVYYVAPGTMTYVDHSNSNLTISGKILVMTNALLIINMGTNSFTMSVGGALNICDGGRLDFAPGHDFTLNGNNPSPVITLGISARIHACTMHDIKFNTGTIYMNDYATIEFGNYHGVGSNSKNMIVYTGSGAVGIGSGNPIFHTGGDDFVNFSNTNNLSSNITNSPHIDYVNDNLGTDKPGTANYCGPKTSPSYASCRTQWSNLPTTIDCGDASTIQAVLPLHLTRFNYSLFNNNCTLSWSIVNGKTVDHFELERSSGNESFQKIENIVPGIDAASDLNYSYSDLRPVISETAYRLKLVGKDGKIAYSNILLVHPQSQQQNIINCYPNPFKDQFQLRTSFSEATTMHLELYENTGNRVMERQLSIGTGNRVSGINNLSLLPSGIYILKMTTKTNNYFQRIIKE